MHGVDEMNMLIEYLSLSSEQPKQQWFQSLEGIILCHVILNKFIFVVLTFLYNNKKLNTDQNFIILKF